MTLQIGVKLTIKNQNDEYLLLRKNPAKHEPRGQWDIPGGKIDPSTSLLDSLKRELQKELGINLIIPVYIIGAQDILVANRDDRGVLAGEMHIIRLTYYGEMEKFDPTISDEYIGFGWYSKAEMLDLGLNRYFKELLDANIIP